MILLDILMGYDFKLKKTPPRDPLSEMYGLLMVPDMTVEFLFKRRSSADVLRP